MTDFDTSPIIIEDSTPPSVRGERLTGRYGMVSLVGASLRSEAGIRDAIAKLTAWLDAPRLAARATAEVVETRPARDGTGDAKLVRSVGFDEWAVISPSGNLYCGWGAMGDGERQARGVFNIVTTKEASK